MSDVRKIGLVATRDFVATVTTKGFVVGLLIFPAFAALAAVVGPRLMSARSPQIVGDVAIIDPTGVVAVEVRSTISPSAIEERRAENARRTIGRDAPGVAAAGVSEQAVRQAVGQIPILTLRELPAESDPQREKAWLTTRGEGARPRLALVVVHADAVTRAAPAGDYGSYDLYSVRALNEATETSVHEALRVALVRARLKAGNFDPQTITDITYVRRPAATIVSAAGEQRMRRGFTQMLPFALSALLFVGIMVGGQGLMTSTIEEKSSRVVEVILASVSPFELMAGKLIAQLGIGLISIGVYVGLGLLALFQFAMFGLVDLSLVVYLLVFYVLSYLVFGALMMTIGAAVNEMTEAQSLFGPVILVLMVPYLLSPIIGRTPNSLFATIASFVPPTNMMVMLMRLSSDAPPPMWQVAVTIVIGLGAAYAAVWFAAKIFKIGLLMHGKPPNFATLVRWARAA